MILKKLSRKIQGHWTWGRLTVYGFDAMHVAANVWTKRWGYLCFHPPMRHHGRYWPWYFYASRDATPQSASWGIGPGFRKNR